MKNLTAVILCGGKGIRLRPLTNDVPKPLIKINDEPILSHVLKHLTKYKISKFMIATGYQSKKIEDFMRDNYKELDYTIVNSGDTDILSRVKDCIKHLDTDMLLCYGDTISNIDLEDLLNFHKCNINDVIISSYPIEIPFGVMEIDNNYVVTSFLEKPILKSVMNIGYYYFNKKDFSIIDNSNDIIDLINKLINTKSLKCYKHQGIHITINTLTELELANENIKKIFK